MFFLVVEDNVGEPRC